MALLHRDLNLISNTISIGHPTGTVPLSHLTKEMASLLLDQSLLQPSSLRRRSTIHGVETVSVNSGIFQKPSAIDGNLSKLAEGMNYYQILHEESRKLVKFLSSNISLEKLVIDDFLYTEEARLLGKLDLTEKIVLAGHRNTKMTLHSLSSVSQLLEYALENIKRFLLLRDNGRIRVAIDKACECARELTLKANYYPSLVPKLKAKLEFYPSVAAAMFASTLEEDQGPFDKHIARTKLIERGTHLLRSIIHNLGLYGPKSKELLVEVIRFRQACKSCNVEMTPTNLTNDPIILADFLLGVLRYERNLEAISVEQNA